MKFRKKPVVIEAVQFTGNNWPTVNRFVGKLEIAGYEEPIWGFGPLHIDDAPEFTATVWDKLHNTWVGVKAGQWIIKGVQGEFYPCDEEVFKETYEAVEE